MSALYSVDARTGETFGPAMPVTSPNELDRRTLEAAQATEAWATTPAVDRGAALERIAAALEDHRDELVELADRESGLGVTRLQGEVVRTANQLRLFATMLRTGQHVGAVISPGDPATGTPDVRRMLWPIGPVAVFSASNFPFAFSTVGTDSASALAAGCPVVVKAHEGHMQTTARVTDIVHSALAESGAPPGVFASVYGVEAGTRLVRHPSIRAVGFTGSLAGGRALLALTAKREDPIPFFGELGSINPVVVLPGAAQRRAAEIGKGFVGSFTLGSGQFCTKPGLLFVPAGSAVATHVRDATLASSAGPMLTGKIRSGFSAALQDSQWQALALLARGHEDRDLAVTPEVRIASVEEFVAGAPTLVEERFGPAALLVTYESSDELRLALTMLPGSLTGAIHADEDDSDVDWVAEGLRAIAGRLIMNGWPTGVAVNWAMHHGGPWPASTSSAHTSVGAMAIHRWLRPVAYQDWPADRLPPELRDDNPLHVPQLRA
jgi:NADP-dependent aldehyde dehydrogenase